MNASLIGRLPNKARTLGPVAAVSYRVASRIANTLNAGTAARSVDELNAVRTILFHAPYDQMASILGVLRDGKIEWPSKSLIFCDCEAEMEVMEEFRALGASVAGLRGCAIPGRLVVQGSAPALTTARGMIRQLDMKAIELPSGSRNCFEAAVTMGSSALTPLIDHAADLLRACGIRDNEAPELAAALFQQTARDYAHSGKQSWAWYVREPDFAELEAQIEAAGNRYKVVLRELMLAGLEGFEKHPGIAKALRRPAIAEPGLSK